MLQLKEREAVFTAQMGMPHSRGSILSTLLGRTLDVILEGRKTEEEVNVKKQSFKNTFQISINQPQTLIYFSVM